MKYSLIRSHRAHHLCVGGNGGQHQVSCDGYERDFAPSIGARDWPDSGERASSEAIVMSPSPAKNSVVLVSPAPVAAWGGGRGYYLQALPTSLSSAPFCGSLPAHTLAMASKVVSSIQNAGESCPFKLPCGSYRESTLEAEFRGSSASCLLWRPSAAS